MLFDHLTADTAEMDVLQVVGELHEALDAPALERAWARTAQRHPALRSGFRWQGLEEPLRLERAEARVDFALLDEAGARTDEHREIVARRMDAERIRGFDLSRPPLARLTALRFEPSHHALILTVHHVLMDAVSFPTLLRDLFALYEAEVSGDEASLPPPQGDGSEAHSADRDAAREEAFWRDLLRGFRTPTPLSCLGDPSVRDPSAIRRGEAELRLSEETTRALRNQASSLGVSMSTLVQGAWALLLGRYCGEEDVVFGSVRRVVDGGGADSNGAIGLSINTLPMRVRLDEAAPLEDLLRSVRRQHLAIGPNRATPLPDVRRQAEVPGRTPLFETFVVFNHESLGRNLRAQGDSWARRDFRLAESLSSLPLGLYAYADPRLQLRLVYDRERLEESSAMRILAHVERLLSGMADGTRESAAALPMLTAAEVRCLEAWNDTRRAAVDPRCIHELIEERARSHPDAVALIAKGSQVSYRELEAWSDALARELRSLGVGPDVLVGIHLWRSIEMVVGVLATLKAGGAYLPLDPEFPSPRLAYMIGDAKVRFVLSEPALADRLPDGIPQIVRVPGRPAAPPAPAAGPKPSPGNLAYVIYTSGSTGNPKGVMVEHRTVVNFFQAMDAYVDASTGGVWLAVTSLSFDISVLELLWTLARGFSVVVYPGESVAEVSGGEPAQAFPVADHLERHRVTHLQCTPSMALMMTLDDACRQALSGLRQLLIGGEAFPVALAQELREITSAEIVNLYGPTETTIWSSAYPVPGGELERREGGAVVPIGWPVLNTSFHVVDRRLRRVPPGAAGELLIGGEGVTRGYYERADLTRERFVSDPEGPGDGSRLYRTGDLVRHGSDGCLHFLGRMDDQVKIRGYRIEPAEIELHLERHSGVEQAAVVAQGPAHDVRHLRACVVPAQGGEPSPDALQSHLRVLLPDYMVPGEFLFLDRLPLTPNKKLDRRALAELRPAPSAPSRAPARQGLEAEVAALWQRVLGDRPIGRDDNFFDLGGDSFLAMRLHHELEENLGREFPLVSLFKLPTIRLLAEHLGRAGEGADVRRAMERGRARRKRRMRSRKERDS